MWYGKYIKQVADVVWKVQVLCVMENTSNKKLVWYGRE